MSSSIKVNTDTDLGVFSFMNDSSKTFDINLIVKAIKNFSKKDDLSQIDLKILQEIENSLNENKNLPFGFTTQEKNFLLREKSFDNWIIYLIYRYKFKNYPKNFYKSEFPIYVLIEIISVCNLRCVMCYQSDKSFTKKPYMGSMDENLFYKIIDELHEGGTNAITFGSRGEPTLHNKIGDFIDYTSGKFLDFKLITNATRLNEDLSHRILSSNVNLLTFSIDAYDKKTYEEIRLRSDFDLVFNNINRFNKIREKHYPNSSLITRVSGVKVKNSNQNENKFLDFWKPYVDEVGMKSAFERWDTYSNEPHPDFITPCSFLWERMYIWFNGLANPCDSDYKSFLSYGNLKDSSIKDLWNSKLLDDLRESHLAKKRSSCYPCDRCGAA